MSVEVSKQNVVYALDRENQPVTKVPNGSRLTFHTCDCFEDQIDEQTADFGSIDWNRINPATGPVFVEEAEPGDLLEVHIEHITLAGQGVMTTGPGLGVLGDELTHNVIRRIPVRDGMAQFAEDIWLPLNPMIGVIGTAPGGAAVPCGTPGEHGGNMDCTRITEGARLLLPVSVPGALLAMGDLHAAMADGEAAVCGVEIAGSVTVTVRVITGKTWAGPMIINPDHVITIASAPTLDEASVLATKNMVRLLETECGMDTAEAVFLCSVAGQLRICQVVDPLKTVRVEVPRWILERRGFQYPAEATP